MPIPSINTERLTLRPFDLSDAADIQRLAGDRRIAETTLLIPHPYPDGAAEEWINTHESTWDEGKGATWAITQRDGGGLVGAIGLIITPDHHHAEMGYWVGHPYWGTGLCTEAAAAVLEFAFNTLDLNRVHAHHFGNNPASGRVLLKIGMTPEGTLRQHIRKWDRYQDAVLYAVLRSEYES